ncbi:amidase [Leucobacter komagatae]|uniref:Amidase n=1 Tax=Leucobacter komagatae TaxID=55969 RepID=A0A542Y841_9MICO|nr:acetamidase/formamidase family protein [Leucobacter komagatae]TQL44235.1 amidase [Leucobacter komagatae]
MRRISAASAITAFSAHHEPVAVVALGEVFECETEDCYAGQITSEAVLRPHIDMAHFNRATGPVFVEGVRAGDMIRVDIEGIDIADAGIMALSPGLGVLGERITEPSTRVVQVRDGYAWITPDTPVPVAPMIGVIGVAPAGEPVGSSWPGAHGGNLDTRLLHAGTAIFLRAHHDGALLAVGDLHAVQGDGELGGTGVEIAGRVRLRVERAVPCADATSAVYSGELPALIHEDGLSLLASAETLDEAVRMGFSTAVDQIQAWRGLPWEDAYRMTSLIARTEVSQAVNPLVTARVTIPHEWCPASLFEASDA